MKQNVFLSFLSFILSLIFVWFCAFNVFVGWFVHISLVNLILCLYDLFIYLSDNYTRKSIKKGITFMFLYVLFSLCFFLSELFIRCVDHFACIKSQGWSYYGKIGESSLCIWCGGWTSSALWSRWKRQWHISNGWDSRTERWNSSYLIDSNCTKKEFYIQIFVLFSSTFYIMFRSLLSFRVF